MNYNPNRKEISLTPVLANALNQPRYTHKDGDFPLYPHSVDSKIELKRPENWHKQAVSNYNSPSNIRTLCLSIDGANMFYWAPPIKGNKPAPQTASGDYTLDKTGKAGIRQRLDAGRYVFANTGLQALVNPVVLSNIEELWITPELLNTPRYQQYYNQLCNLQQGQVVGVDFLTSILEAEISTPSKPRTVADTFPLLRAIVVVKLPPNSAVFDFHKLATRSKEVSQKITELYPKQRRAVGEIAQILTEIAKKTGVGIAAQPILTGNITKFSIGSYKYDVQVLSAVRDKIVAKYTEPRSVSSIPEVKSDTSTPVKADITPKVDTPTREQSKGNDIDPVSLDELIQAMEAESDKTTVIKQALYAYSQANPDYFKRQLPTLSAEMKKKYASVFNK